MCALIPHIFNLFVDDSPYKQYQVEVDGEVPYDASRPTHNPPRAWCLPESDIRPVRPVMTPSLREALRPPARIDTTPPSIDMTFVDGSLDLDADAFAYPTEEELATPAAAVVRRPVVVARPSTAASAASAAASSSSSPTSVGTKSIVRCEPPVSYRPMEDMKLPEGWIVPKPSSTSASASRSASASASPAAFPSPSASAPASPFSTRSPSPNRTSLSTVPTSPSTSVSPTGPPSPVADKAVAVARPVSLDNNDTDHGSNLSAATKGTREAAANAHLQAARQKKQQDDDDAITPLPPAKPWKLTIPA
ncbi:MAG: hypothetical protein M1838_002931 [Thelocarpon superellum]|nr:MAG: hypothetical protein M1838_002931 [Thelocarpon superellum]